MKTTIKILFTTVFYLKCLLVYCEVNEDTVKYCSQKYYEAGKDYPRQPLETVVNKWKKYQKACSVEGIYEYNLADIYALYQKYDVAEDILLQTIKKANYDTKNLEFLLGIMYGDSDNFTKYKSLSDTLITKYPDWFGGYYHLAIYNTMVKPNYFIAENYLLKSLELVDFKNSFYVLCSLASIEFYLNKPEKMAKYYLQSLESNSGCTANYSEGVLSIEVIKYFIKIGNTYAAKNLINELDKLEDKSKLDIFNNSEYIAIKAQLSE